jgi:hypothetical protein
VFTARGKCGRHPPKQNYAVLAEPNVFRFVDRSAVKFFRVVGAMEGLLKIVAAAQTASELKRTA